MAGAGLQYFFLCVTPQIKCGDNVELLSIPRHRFPLCGQLTNVDANSPEFVSILKAILDSKEEAKRLSQLQSEKATTVIDGLDQVGLSASLSHFC